MEHMLLQLKRPAEQEQALQQWIDQLHTPGTSTYHHWLTAAQFGAKYGPAPSDIDAVVGGFKATVCSKRVHPGGMLVDSGYGRPGAVGAPHGDSLSECDWAAAHR